MSKKFWKKIRLKKKKVKNSLPPSEFIGLVDEELEGLIEKVPKHCSHYTLVAEEITMYGDKINPSYGMICHQINERTLLYHGIEGLFFFDLISKKVKKSKRGIFEVDPKFWSHTSQLSTDKKRLIMFGGINSYDDKGKLPKGNTLYIFDIDREKWDKLETVFDYPNPCRACCSFMHDNKFYVFGGVGSYLMQTRDMNIHELNLITMEWSKYELKRLPPKRYSHCCVTIDKDRVLTGFGQYYTSYNDLYIFNIPMKKWFTRNTSGVPPSPRGYNSVVKHNNKLIFYGGRDRFNERFNSLHTLSINSWRWREINIFYDDIGRRLPLMAGHSCVVVKDKLIIFGGSVGNSEDGEKSNRMYEIYLPTTMKIKREHFLDVEICVFD